MPRAAALDAGYSQHRMIAHLLAQFGNPTEADFEQEKNGGPKTAF